MLRVILFITCYLVSQSMTAQSIKIGVIDQDSIKNNSLLFQWSNDKAQIYMDTIQKIITKEYQSMAKFQKKGLSCGSDVEQFKVYNRESSNRMEAMQTMQENQQIIAFRLEKSIDSLLNLILKHSYKTISDSLEYDLILDKKYCIFYKNRQKNKHLEQLILNHFNQQYTQKEWQAIITPLLNKAIVKIQSHRYLSRAERAKPLRRLDLFVTFLLRPFHY